MAKRFNSTEVPTSVTPQVYESLSECISIILSFNLKQEPTLLDFLEVRNAEKDKNKILGLLAGAYPKCSEQMKLSYISQLGNVSQELHETTILVKENN